MPPGIPISIVNNQIMRWNLSDLLRPLPLRRRPQPTSRAVEWLEQRLVLATDVLTYHMDVGSTGLNSSETELTPSNVTVNSFGKLDTVSVDGQVYAEPLVATGINIVAGPNTSPGGTGLHDVVFVATQHDTIYAIDASAADATILWQRSFLDTNVAGNNTLGASQITSVPDNDTGTSDISPEVGITGTPVIDQARGVMYVVVKTKETISGDDHYVQRLHAININDGTDRVTPYLIGDTTDGNTNQTAIFVYGDGDGAVADSYHGTNNSVVEFNALREHQRGALSLVNNTVYVEWASHGDNGPYHGWVATWDVSHLNSQGMVLNGVLNVSPNDGLSGIWQGGGRLAFESDGSAFYFETGNGSGGPPHLNGAGFPNNGNYNEALVKVVKDGSTNDANQNPNGWGLKVVDYFIPFNVQALDNADSDFGSGAPIILPDAAGIPGHPHLMIAGGKEGKLYLIDRDHLGHYDSNNDHVLNAESDGSGHSTPPGSISGLLGTPAWFNDELYVLSGYGGQGQTFTVNNDGTLTQTSETSVGNFGYLPGSPTISSNGTANGIVWILDRNANALHAYDASTLATELWNSNQKVGGADQLGAVIKFAVPTVANGRVFVGTSNALVIYGLLSPPDAVPDPSILTATALSGTAVRLTWTDSTAAPNTANIYSIEESTDGSNFNPVASAAAGAMSLSIGGLQPLTHYYFRITGTNSLGDSLPSNTAEVTTTDQLALLDFSGGFAGAADQLQFNGSTSLNGTALDVTDSGENEAGSAFSLNAVDVTGFTTEFTFQISAGSDIADGFTFTIQGNGPTALGDLGGELGYGTIANSIAVKFDLYDNAGEGTNSTGLFTNGESPTGAGSIDLDSTGIDLHSGHQFHVEMIYDGTTLSVTITDTQTQQSTTHDYSVDIPQLVGSNSGYVGFTGGTGGLAAVQSILDWTYTPTATTSPAAPSGLGATPASATSIQLNWTGNSTNQLGYHLDRALDVDFTQGVVTQTLPSGSTTFLDTTNGLAPGSTYYYRLRAFNSVGDSDNSNAAQVTIPLAPPKPSNQQIDDVTATEIDISWQDNAGHQADGYRILRAANHGSFVSVATLPPTSRTAPSTYSWTDEGVAPGTLYEYHILAFNVSGNNDFAGVNATTLTIPPSNLVAAGGSGVVTLTWDAPTGAVSFNIFRGTTPNGEDATPLATLIIDATYVDTNVTVGQTYYYKVTAVNVNTEHEPVLPSESDFSDEASTTVTATPGMPLNVVASSTENQLAPQVVLNWNTPGGGALSYNIYRSLDSQGDQQPPIASGVTATTFTDNDVSFGTTYYYRVTAINNDGEGPAFLVPAVVPVFHVRINFTGSGGDPVAGYLADVGQAFGERGNGLAFGWKFDDLSHGVDANSLSSPDELHDSFHVLHPPRSPKNSWKISVPDGNYLIRIVAGDPGDTSSQYRIDVAKAGGSKVHVIRGQASAEQPWLENTVMVTVKKGTLSIRGAGPGPNKIDAIEITAAPANVVRAPVRRKH